MSKCAAVYLAHLNPITKSHFNIISNLKKEYQVYLFPVRFLKNGLELNTRSFPFSFEIRKSMVQELFGDSVKILSAYTFCSPYLRYLPPLVSPYSWKMRREILDGISEDNFFSYTGDRAESWMLKMYGLKPILNRRLEISGTSVRALLYLDASSRLETNERIRNSWHDQVPPQIIEIIYKNWEMVRHFADTNDRTIRVFGMKFPQEGLVFP